MTCRLPRNSYVRLASSFLARSTLTGEYRNIVNAFVTGLEGRVAGRTHVQVDYINPDTGRNEKLDRTLEKGEFFRIRWDWDNTRGVHVNAEFGTTNAAKIAFRPDAWKPSGTDPEMYHRAVTQLSQRLNYNTVLNQAITPQQRTGRPADGPNNAAQILTQMAQELARYWAAYIDNCKADGAPK